MSQYQHLDDLIKEYLLFRGFANTLKIFEADLKSEKEKGFRVDRIIDQLMQYISNHDLSSLRELWTHLNTKLFSRLEHSHSSAVAKFEASFLKLYVVSCTKQPEKVKEFFERMATELQGQADWREWFALPFVRNPEENPAFQNYFSRQWQDTLLLSFYNFLALVYSCTPPPKLADFQNTSMKLRRLRDDNESMRTKLLNIHRSKSEEFTVPVIPPPQDQMDDFCIIAQETPNADNQVKTLKGFLRNITGGGGSTATNTNGPKKPSPAMLRQNPVASKSRSSSRSRPVSSESNALIRSGSQHAPVKRVAQSISSQPILSNTDLPAVITTAPKNDTSTGGQFLLINQEEYSEHNSEVVQCKLTSSGYLVASGDVDGIVKVWSSSPSPQTHATFIANSTIVGLDWIPGSERHFLYGTKSGIVRLCDKDERKTACDFSTPNDLLQLVCSPSGAYFLAASSKDNGQLLLFDLKTSQQFHDFLEDTPSSAPVTTCIFNHNSQLIMAGSKDGKIKMFDFRKKDCIASWSTGSSGVTTLQLGHDETQLFALDESGRFSAWSVVQTGKRVSEVLIDDKYFEEVRRTGWGRLFTFEPEASGHFLSCSSNGGVIYRQGETVEKVLGLKGHKAPTTCVDWSAANNGTCLTAGKDGKIRISTLLNQ